MRDGWVRLSEFEPPKVGPALLADLELVNRHFAAQREMVPPPLLREGLVDHLDYLRGLLGQSLPDDLQSRLLVITSDAACRVAWNSYQLGLWHEARDDVRFAQHLAKEARDGERLAAALIYEADFERDLRPDDPGRALRLAEAAVIAAGPHADPQTTMVARLTRGEMHAAAGDLFASTVDLYAAQEIMVASGPWGQGQGLCPPNSEAEFAAIRGSCELRLGTVEPSQARAAVDTLAAAFAELAPHRVSWRATVQANLGAAFAEIGEPEQAARTLIDALNLARRDGAQHNVRRVAGIRQNLLNGDVPAVRELDDRLRAPA
jgi:tetratricopeptide (TPR) repeat protein